MKDLFYFLIGSTVCAIFWVAYAILMRKLNVNTKLKAGLLFVLGLVATVGIWLLYTLIWSKLNG